MDGLTVTGIHLDLPRPSSSASETQVRLSRTRPSRSGGKSSGAGYRVTTASVSVAHLSTKELHSSPPRRVVSQEYTAGGPCRCGIGSQPGIPSRTHHSSPPRMARLRRRRISTTKGICWRVHPNSPLSALNAGSSSGGNIRLTKYIPAIDQGIQKTFATPDKRCRLNRSMQHPLVG
jgi:hypothetical protein